MKNLLIDPEEREVKQLLVGKVQHQLFKTRAAKEGMTMLALLSDVLDEFLDSSKLGVERKK